MAKERAKKAKTATKAFEQRAEAAIFFLCLSLKLSKRKNERKKSDRKKRMWGQVDGGRGRHFLTLYIHVKGSAATQETAQIPAGVVLEFRMKCFVCGPNSITRAMWWLRCASLFLHLLFWVGSVVTPCHFVTKPIFNFFNFFIFITFRGILHKSHYEIQGLSSSDSSYGVGPTTLFLQRIKRLLWFIF